MSWITVVWSMVASACLTLAGVHLLVWYQRRLAWASLLFAIATVGMFFMVGCEHGMMRARTPEHFATVLRWYHVPVWVVVVSLVGFVLVYLRAGRRWLAWTICALRTVSLLLNFLVGQNINYLEVTHLRSITFLGESVSVAEGSPNPLMLIGQVSLLLLLVFLTDALITTWRRGDRRKALLVGGSFMFFALAGFVQSLLVLWHVVELPLMASPFYLGILLAIGSELSRKMAQFTRLSESLRESQERLALATAAAGIGIWAWDTRSDQIWTNEQWALLYGFAPGESVTRDQVAQRIHPEDRDLLEQARRRAVQEGTDYAQEYRVRLPDGTERWILSRGRLSTRRNQPALLVGAALDITTHKRTDEALLRLTRKDQEALRVAQMGHWEYDMATAQFIFNDQYYSLHGMTAQAAGGYLMSVEKFTAKYVHPDDAHLVAEHVRRAIETNDPGFQVQAEARILRADGEPRNVTVWFRIEKDSRGRTIKLHGVNQDITARKRAEEARKGSEEMLHSIFSSSPDAITMVDLSGRIMLCNQSTAIIHGYSSAEHLIGMKVSELVAAEDHPNMVEARQRVMIHGFAMNVPFTGRKGSGGTFPGEISFSVLKDGSGQPIGYVGITRDITERKRTGEKLRHASYALEHSPVLVAITDTEGRITYVNRKYSEVTGYSFAEASGQNPRILKSGVCPPSLYQQMWATISSGKTWRGEFHNRKKNGEFYWAAAVISPLLDATGRITNYVEISEDITEHKRIQEALRESESRFRTVANTAPVLIWMARPDKLCDFFNQSWLEFTGRTLAQELGNGWAEGVHPDDLAACLKAYGEAFDARRPFTLEYRLRRHDGEYRWISDHGVPRYDYGRNFLGYIGSCVDFTDRKRAEAELQLSEERLRLVLEANSEGVWDWHIPSGRFFCSPRYTAMLGYAPEEFARDIDAWAAFVHPDDLQRVQRANVAQTQQGRDFDVEFRMRKKSGGWCLVRSRGTIVERNAEGGPLRMVGTHQDITELKARELEIAQQRDELAHFSRLTTMSELSSSLAHELNQPLAIILTNAQAAQRIIVQQPPDLAEAQEILADIVKEDQRAGLVIQRLRALLKPGQICLLPVSVHDIIEDVLMIARSDLIGRDIRVHTVLAGGLPLISGDQIQLQQVLLNLILNACDAMADNPPTDRHLVLATTCHDNMVRISISDNGCGLPPEMGRLFEPFYTTKKQGLGMGLTICRSIITAHNGRLWAEPGVSASGSSAPATTTGGATFCLELPALGAGDRGQAISNQ